MFDLTHLQLHKARAFLLTFFAYAILTAARVPFPIAKSSLHPDHVDDTTPGYAPFNSSAQGSFYLGCLDTVFLLAYSFGLFVSGAAGDRLNLRYFLSAGMLSAGLFCLWFGLSASLNIHFFPYFLICQLGAGLAQSVGWPCVVSIISRWFQHGRGTVMGVWNASSSIGNVFGKLIATSALTFSWSWSFLVIGMLCIAMAVVEFMLLETEPESVLNENELRILYLTTHETLPLRNQQHNHDVDELSHQSSSNDNHKPISFTRALLIPGVIPFSLSLFFSKLCVYAFLSWLPFYLSEELHYSQSVAGTSSIVYDVGSVVGGIVAGLASDWSRRSGCVSFVMLIGCVPLLFLYQGISVWGVFWNCLVMFFIGIFVNGPFTLICSAVTADLGSHPSLKGNKSAMATVAGIIDGTGSIGSAVQGILIGWLSSVAGWKGVFWMLTTCCLCAAAMIVNVVKSELTCKAKATEDSAIFMHDKAINASSTAPNSDDDESIIEHNLFINSSQSSDKTPLAFDEQTINSRSPLLGSQS